MHSRPSSEAKEYDARWSGDEYSSEHIGYTPFFLEFINRCAVQQEGKAHGALDLGCGNGFFSRHLNGMGYAVTGIDVSAVAIKQAAAATREATFVLGDLSVPFPFANDSFHLVWCSEVLEHLFSPLFALREIHRVLRKGGRLLCTVPYHGLLKNIGIALFAFERHFDPEYPHLRFFTRNSLAGIVSKSGLIVDDVDSCGSNLGLRDWFVPTNILLSAHKP